MTSSARCYRTIPPHRTLDTARCQHVATWKLNFQVILEAMEGLQPNKKENKEPAKLEKIVAAAIRFNGEIVTGVNHALATRQLEKMHPDWQKMSTEPVEEGFLTSSGRFVDRREAAEIAERAAQTNEAGIDSRMNPEELDSSELKTIH